MSQRPGPRPLERLLVSLVFISSLGLTALLVLQRLQVESRRRSVAIAFPEDRLLSATARDADAPRQLQAAGVTTLVRRPHTLETLIRFGLAEVWHPEPERMEIRLADSLLSGKAAIYLTGQLGMEALQIRFREDQYLFDLRLPQAMERIEPDRYILEIPSGPMPGEFQRALLLPAGDWGATHDLDQFTQAIYSLKPDLVIPVWRGGVGARSFYRSYFLTPWLRRPLVAIPEFNPPPPALGILAQQRRHHLMRIHQTTEQTASELSDNALRRRWLRAVRERGINLVYLEAPETWAFDRSLALIRGLSADLRAAGFHPGPAEPPRRVRSGYLALSLIYLGVGALLYIFIWQAALWAVGYTGQDERVDGVLTIRLKPAYFRWIAAGAAGFLLVLHWEGYAAWGSKAAALLVACVAPLAGLAALPTAPAHEARWPGLLGRSMVDFLTLTGCSLAGGLVIAVLLFQPEFIHRFDVFWGVKAAALIPVLAGVIFLFPAVTDSAWWQERWSPGHRVWTLAGLMLLALAVAYWLLRSGNAGQAWILPGETWVRETLESVLGVRPRFKEYLIGHPLLLIGLAGRRLSGRPGRIWPEVCIALGLIGQVSLINTFCHLHTPLAVSLARSFLGLGIGLLLGIIGLGLVRAVVVQRGLAWKS